MAQLIQLWIELFFKSERFIFRHIRIAIAFVIVPFLPSAHLIPVGFLVADRVLYISSLGYCVLIACGIHSLMPKGVKVVRVLYVILLVTFIIRSNERSMDWQNNLNLFTSAIRICPNNAKIYYNLGQIHAHNGDFNKSLEFNLIANELNPNNIGVLTNLGNAYRHVGNAQAALKHHKTVVGIDPSYPLGWMNLGISYVQNGLYEDALAAYQKSDQLKPNNGKILFNLGNLVRAPICVKITCKNCSM